ncbi:MULTISPECIES: hypothetical protein [Listeria]|uniref:hypothetical protein n=1 Tax=Listeria TaxID=1637 RepID=UPI001F07FA2D|nr:MULTISPECIES: hypothetical protein [Listeria]
MKKATVLIGVALLMSGVICFILSALKIGNFEQGWALTAFVAGVMILIYEGLQFYIAERKKARKSNR